MASLTATDFQSYLSDLGASSEAMNWAGDRTAQQAWDDCERADWLMWWLAKAAGTEHKQLVRIACACARTALPYVQAGELRPLRAIETAEAWCDGRATIAEVRKAYAAAYADVADAADVAAARTKANREMCALIRAAVQCPKTGAGVEANA